jgi:hypothetical protein
MHERARLMSKLDADDVERNDDEFQIRRPSDWQRSTSSAVLGGDPDDSQVELPAFTSAADSSAEVEAVTAFEPENSELATAVPRYYKVIESLGRVHFYVVLLFAASSLAVLVFLLVSALVAGQTLSSSITALIIGCVGMIAFLLLSLPATMLMILVIDLARSVRVLIQQTNRNPARVIETRSQSRTTFSHRLG